ncbi:MAG: transposase [Planctomycetota bacterium]
MQRGVELRKSWGRHERLSVEAALTISPERRRVGLYFRIHSHNIRFRQTMEFITLVHRHLRRKFILVLDRLNVHRKAVRLLLEKHPDWFEPAWLPAYAPELNPVEQVWNRSKYSHLANFIPHDIDHLECELDDSLQRQRSATVLLRGFFKHAGLSL